MGQCSFWGYLPHDDTHFRAIICASFNGSKLGFFLATYRGLVEVGSEVKWIVNMLIMVYFNKNLWKCHN
jgi:hypothetical protein